MKKETGGIKNYGKLPDIITPRQFAEYMNLNRKTVYKAIHSGDIDAFPKAKGCSEFLIEKSELLRYIKERKKEKS